MCSLFQNDPHFIGHTSKKPHEKRQENMEDRGAETVDCLLLTKPYVNKVLCISRIS